MEDYYGILNPASSAPSKPKTVSTPEEMKTNPESPTGETREVSASAGSTSSGSDAEFSSGFSEGDIRIVFNRYELV